MPSWNMHIAHAERLLKGGGSVARAVRDGNAFLFGNLIPDIYVGYMVPGVVRPVPYRVTHFAKPEHIPKPRAGEFFDAYVLPLARECGLLDALGDDCATGEVSGRPVLPPVPPVSWVPILIVRPLVLPALRRPGTLPWSGPGGRPPPSQPRLPTCLPRTRRRSSGISMWPKLPRASAMRLRPPDAR